MVGVTDTGVGIQPEHLPRVFERFYRVDPARSRDDGGTGIGLAIARSIVEAHGGRIVAKSDPGRGSAFTFDLPAVEAAVAADDRRVR
jgi:signal transduction histidine kinase